MDKFMKNSVVNLYNPVHDTRKGLEEVASGKKI